MADPQFDWLLGILPGVQNLKLSSFNTPNPSLGPTFVSYMMSLKFGAEMLRTPASILPFFLPEVKLEGCGLCCQSSQDVTSLDHAKDNDQRTYDNGYGSDPVLRGGTQFSRDCKGSLQGRRKSK